MKLLGSKAQTLWQQFSTTVNRLDGEADPDKGFNLTREARQNRQLLHPLQPQEYAGKSYFA